MFLNETEKKFMQILYEYADSSPEDKRFLIVNCDNVFSENKDVSVVYLYEISLEYLAT